MCPHLFLCTNPISRISLPRHSIYLHISLPPVRFYFSRGLPSLGSLLPPFHIAGLDAALTILSLITRSIRGSARPMTVRTLAGIGNCARIRVHSDMWTLSRRSGRITGIRPQRRRVETAPPVAGACAAVRLSTSLFRAGASLSRRRRRRCVALPANGRPSSRKPCSVPRGVSFRTIIRSTGRPVRAGTAFRAAHCAKRRLRTRHLFCIHFFSLLALPVRAFPSTPACPSESGVAPRHALLASATKVRASHIRKRKTRFAMSHCPSADSLSIVLVDDPGDNGALEAWPCCAWKSCRCMPSRLDV